MFLTRNLASIQSVARFSLCLFLRHLVHAAKQRNQRVVPTFTRPLLILNKRMTLLTDHTFGIISMQEAEYF